MKTRLLSIQGTSIAIHESDGDAAPIVLLHGNSVSSLAFRRQLEGNLGTTHRLLALDFPGHGKSGIASAPEEYSMPGLARVVVQAAQQLDVLDATFLGWSLGGHVLLEAIRDLEDAAGFAIFGTPPLQNPLSMERAFHPHPVMADLWNAELSDQQVVARVASMFSAGAPLPSELLQDVRDSDPGFRRDFLASLGSIGFADEVEIVAKLQQPLLVIHGAADQVVNLEYLRELPMPSLWRGHVHVVPNAAHAVQWEAPDAFDAIVHDFVRDAAGVTP